MLDLEEDWSESEAIDSCTSAGKVFSAFTTLARPVEGETTEDEHDWEVDEGGCKTDAVGGGGGVRDGGLSLGLYCRKR